ncbi:hypothetical protein PIROE2DRAFT_14051 [Piromyces sp. E2]|nr:hypothetical protein PIROE2DRAFT_14051 [Piromyces sp. E2]|eukprot:OUM60235.1 hypothetical protein PIROE2DRAFT_14051 [Piromyces sp. E2]
MFTDENKCLKIKIKSSNFDNNRGLFYIANASLILEDCTFTNIQKDSSNIKSVLFYSNAKSRFEHLVIKDSKFIDIDVMGEYPLIDAKGIKLEFENTNFINCHSDYGYLFSIGNNIRIDKEVIISNSKFSSIYI